MAVQTILCRYDADSIARKVDAFRTKLLAESEPKSAIAG